MPGRYIKLEDNLYFDTKDRVIVKNMGGRFVFVRHDRRRKNIPVSIEQRQPERMKAGMRQIGINLYFDPTTKQIFKQIGDKLVLYSKDRRKQTKKVEVERRKEK
ncbi:MAG: hypothetical protein N2114_01625 [Candidatus Goldbacteria bacterium]|nr:hypothetical protein [Candidatus Goldiibacteriota bacterium]